MVIEGRSVLFLGSEEQLPLVRSFLPTDYSIHRAATDDALDQTLPMVDAVIDASMALSMNRRRIDSADRLRVYVTATTGADHVDASALEERGIPLLTLRGERELLRDITAAAEHSWLLLLAAVRGLPGAIDQTRSGGWDRTLHPGPMLRGRTLGIVGCGRIGQWMARYATAFGMRCLGFDPYADPFPAGIEATPLDALMRNADFVTVHVPLTEDTHHLLGRKELALLRPTAVVVNTSRGEILDEDALADMLEHGDLAGAGLDVLTGEPDVGQHRMLRLARQHPNVVVTPHIGGFSPDALARVLEFSCRRVADYLQSCQ